jgi:hypothetical protein
MVDTSDAFRGVCYREQQFGFLLLRFLMQVGANGANGIE